MILDQQDRDNAVRYLLKKLSEVYTFMNEDGRLAEIVTMQEHSIWKGGPTDVGVC